MRLTDLATAPPITADDSQVAGGLALEIERTLGTLNKESIKEIRAEIKNLPKVLSSLEISRKNDILLNVLAQATEPKSARHYEAAKKRLRQIKNSGAEDPTADLWLAMLEDEIAAGEDAIARGADKSVSLEEVLDRYKQLDLE
jgi:ribosomal protein S13